MNLNLAESEEAVFRGALHEIVEKDAPVLCLIDECDARPANNWPCEALLSPLLANRTRAHPIVFVLAGSGSDSQVELAENIRRRWRGPDVVDRIPNHKRFDVPTLTLEDRIVVFAVHLTNAARRHGQQLRQIEKLALYCVLAKGELQTPRQLYDFAYAAISRKPVSETRLNFDDLFDRGNREREAFWSALSAEDRRMLEKTYLRVEPLDD